MMTIAIPIALFASRAAVCQQPQPDEHTEPAKQVRAERLAKKPLTDVDVGLVCVAVARAAAAA